MRSSPLVPETVPVCKKCHKTCRTHSNSTPTNINSNNNNNVDHSRCYLDSPRNTNSLRSTNLNENQNEEDLCDDFGRLMLLGLSAVNPAASLVKLDPFSPVPKISVVPPTPDTRSEFRYSESISSKLSISQVRNLVSNLI